MKEIEFSVMVDRPHHEAVKVFDAGIQQWLPSTIGPDERTWRTRTKEGPIDVDVVIQTGPVFVHADGIHWRQFNLQPDRTSMRNVFTAIFTPELEGQLGLAPDDDGRSLLVFEGKTTKRNRLTGTVERLLLGDPLVWSGIDSVLEHIREQLEEN